MVIAFFAEYEGSDPLLLNLKALTQGWSPTSFGAKKLEELLQEYGSFHAAAEAGEFVFDHPGQLPLSVAKELL